MFELAEYDLPADLDEAARKQPFGAAARPKRNATAGEPWDCEPIGP